MDKKHDNLASRGMSLTYVAPEIKEGITVVRLQVHEVHKLQQSWEYAVMVYVMGGKPLNHHFQRYAAAQWQSIKPIKILSHGDGYFIMRLRSEECVRILEGGLTQ